MSSTASISYQWGEDQALQVEVESEATNPDALDEICQRAKFLLTESLTAINAAAPDTA